MSALPYGCTRARVLLMETASSCETKWCGILINPISLLELEAALRAQVEPPLEPWHCLMWNSAAGVTHPTSYIWPGKKGGDIWTAPASELFSQDSALAFTVAAVAFSLLSRRFYGVQPLNPHCRSLFRPIHSTAHPPNRAGIIESVDSLVVFQFVSPWHFFFKLFN